jgi:hypothetical protein
MQQFVRAIMSYLHFYALLNISDNLLFDLKQIHLNKLI